MIKDISYAIVGLGRSGLATCEVLSDLGASIKVFANKNDDISKVSSLNVEIISCSSNDDLAEKLSKDKSDCVIISPGISSTGVIWKYLYDSKRKVLSDVELAWRYSLELIEKGEKVPEWFCITGTNGKTTTTGMLNSIFLSAGLRSCAVGNIGLPVIHAIHEKKYDVLAVELSSFNLHACMSLSPVSACCINVSADHIDWHGSFEDYAADKARIYHACQEACVYNCEDLLTKKMVEEADVIEGCKAVGVTMSTPLVGQIGVVENMIVDRAFIKNKYSHGQILATFEDLKHLCPGSEKVSETLIQDAMFASALARSYGVESAFIELGLRNFVLASHRFAYVDKIDNITYIDDSKATNLHAMLSALKMLPDGRVVLLCGGDAKGADINDVFVKAKNKLKALVILGADHFDILKAYNESGLKIDAKIVEENSNLAEYMNMAVTMAKNFADSGDFVLLSPGCASWDQFKSYKQRGDLFVEAVKRLKG